MMNRVVRAVFAAAVVAGCGSAWADIPASAYVQDGLVGLWDGIENAGAQSHDNQATVWKDLSGNGNDGTVSSNVSWTDNGWTNSSDGQPVTVGSAIAGTLQKSPYTIEMIVTPTALTRRFTYFGNYSSQGFGLENYYGNGANGTIRFYNNNKPDIATGVPVDAGTMNRISLVATPTLQQYYKNGTLAATTEKTLQTLASASCNTVIGGELNRANFAFKGTFHAFRLYNRALTADEITINANVDRVRYEGADPTTLTWPKGIRVNTDIGVLEYAMGVQAAGGSVTVNGQSVSEAYFASGTSVELAATPDSGMKFGWWSGDVPTAKAKDAMVTVTTVGRVMSVTAHFVEEDAVVWFVPNDFASLDAALKDENVKDGDIVKILKGTYVTDEGGKFVATVDKAVRIVGEDDPDWVKLDCNGYGGVKLTNPEATLSGVTIRNFAMKEKAQALVDSCALVSNIVVDGVGSLYRADPPDYRTANVIQLGKGAVLTHSSIHKIDNTSWYSGSVMLCQGGTVRKCTFDTPKCITGNVLQFESKDGVRSTFEDCTVANGWNWCNGILYLKNSDMRRCKFTGGQVLSGGAHAFTLENATATDVIVTGSTYSGNGTAPDILISGNKTVSSLTNVLVYGNKTYNAPVVNVDTGVTAKFFNCTIANNTTVVGTVCGIGGNGSAEFVNCILYGNMDASRDVEFSDTLASRTLSHCCCFGYAPEPGDTNLGANPLFTDAAHGDFTLQATSPCVDAGCDVEGGLDHDLNGDPRPIDGRGAGIALNDIGCYEREQGEISLLVGLVVTGNAGPDPSDVPLSATVVGTHTDGLSFEWKAIRNLAGALTTNTVGTSESTHVFEGLHTGIYTFVCTVRNSLGETATATAENAFAVKPARAYVSLTGSDTWPYTTPETAARDLRTAVEAADQQVIVLPGVYKDFSHAPAGYMAEVQTPLEIVGSDDPSETVIDCGGLAGIQLSAEGAFLHGFTFTNFVAKSGLGHLLFVNKGTISNVVVRGGTTMSVASYDCLNVGWQGRVEDTLVTNLNSTQGYAVNTAGGRFRNLKLVGCAGKATVVASVPTNAQRTRFDDCVFEDGAGISREFVKIRNTDLKSPILRRNALAAGKLINTYGSTMIDGIVRDNTAAADSLVGNWTESWVGTYSRFTNCLFISNTTKSGVFCTDGVVSFHIEYVNCTVAGNVATEGTVCGIAGTGHPDAGEGLNDIKNCLVWGNTAQGQPADVNVLNVLRTKTSVKNSCFAEAAEAPDKGNTAADPLLHANFHIGPESPCCEAGATLGWEKGGKDLDGNPRLFRKRVDMGCYECQVGPGLRVLVR